MFKTILLFAILACSSSSAADFRFSINIDRCDPRPVYIHPSGYWREVYIKPIVQYQYYRGHYHYVIVRPGYYVREWVSYQQVQHYRYR